jgi:hypothetical protein
MIARFEDDAFVSEALFALDDLALAARIAASADQNSMSAGEFVTQAIGQFINCAGDEEWLTLIGLMSRTDNPGQVLLRRALSNSLLHTPACDCK